MSPSKMFYKMFCYPNERILKILYQIKNRNFKIKKINGKTLLILSF
jgi:hypothetical protein